MLRAQTRLQWQIVSTGMFTSFLFEPALGVVDIENSTVRALGDWETAVTVTTPEDIGRLTARIVAEPVGDPIIFCAGDTVTYGQLADTVENLVGRSNLDDHAMGSAKSLVMPHTVLSLFSGVERRTSSRMQTAMSDGYWPQAAHHSQLQAA